MLALCRDCLAIETAMSAACSACGSIRRVAHPELDSLAIAHVDCDAFYASVEKRDRPELRDLPVIVGGGRRGVVATCCYVARRYGIRSAQPMFKALAACPSAIVIKPDMAKYVEAAREIRGLMSTLSPLVEPVGLDEAYLDLTGTERLHGRPPAAVLAGLARDVEAQVGVTLSIGLSYGKLYAKLASERDKPRGFAMIGRAEAPALLATLPARALPGVGPALERSMKANGHYSVGDLQSAEPRRLERLYGEYGRVLHERANGFDPRAVEPRGAAKSISSERTFDTDLRGGPDLDAELWRLCERVAARAKAAGLAGRTVTLKLKTPDFVSRTRRTTARAPIAVADEIFRIGLALLREEPRGERYRLIGIGLSELVAGAVADGTPDLFSAGSRKTRDKLDTAIDSVRSRFGADAIGLGRGLRRPRS